MNVAVVGQGSAGRRHAQILLDLGHHVIACDPYAEPLVGTERCDSLGAALGKAEITVIASPPSLHSAQAQQAIDLGVPTLVEKPLARTAPGARMLMFAARRHRVPLAVAMNMRHHPGVIRLRTQLASIGRVLRVSAWAGSWLPGWHPGADYRRGYSAQQILGGGVLLDVAVHELDYLTWLLGPVGAVTAVVQRVSELEIDVEDTGMLLLEFATGAVGNVIVDYLDHQYHRGCRIVGSEGTLGETLEPDASTYRAQMEIFLKAAEGWDSMLASGADAYHVLQVIDAARLSAAEGRRVEIS